MPALRQRAAVDLFEGFGQFACQHDLPLGAKYSQWVVDAFDDAVHGMGVEHQCGALLAVFMQFLRCPDLERQKP